jgi:hypothetical protein
MVHPKSWQGIWGVEPKRRFGYKMQKLLLALIVAGIAVLIVALMFAAFKLS